MGGKAPIQGNLAAIQEDLNGLERQDIKYLLKEWADGQHCRGKECFPVTITLFSEKELCSKTQLINFSQSTHSFRYDRNLMQNGYTGTK